MIAGEGEIPIKPLYAILMKNQLGNIKQCRTLIRHQRVKVNGKIIDNEKYQVQCFDQIEVDGQIINTTPFVYYMMNKPKGYICANHDSQYQCVIDLLAQKDCHCIGRLDKETTGLLFITNDKSLSKRLLLPDAHIEKTYLVTTLYPLQDILKEQFQAGVIIDRHIKCLPAILQIIDDYHCYVTLYEGKYHQVKKMFLSCQNVVIELKRVSFAKITLDVNLQEGEYRELTQLEFQKLKEFSST